MAIPHKDYSAPISTDMPDSAPVSILRWALIDDLNGLGEAVMIFTVREIGIDTDRVLQVMVNPRWRPYPAITRVNLAGFHAPISVDQLPGNVRDLAVTMVAERFVIGAPIRLWSSN